MQLLQSGGQQRIDDYFDASSSISSASVAQLVLPQRKSCSFFLFVNLSASNSMMLQFGIRPATATLTSGTVSSVAINDTGFGFLAPPDVEFLGGGNSMDPASKGATLAGWPPVNVPAQGRCTIANGTISGFILDSGGAGYLAPPFVYLRPARNDPTGVGTPSATVGIPVAAAGGSYYVNGTFCPTVAVSVWCASTDSYTCKWAP